MFQTNLSLGLKNTLPFVYEESEINARIPRTFEIRAEGDIRHFKRQFRLTACICMLKKFVLTPTKALMSSEGTVTKKQLCCLIYCIYI